MSSTAAGTDRACPLPHDGGELHSDCAKRLQTHCDATQSRCKGDMQPLDPVRQPCQTHSPAQSTHRPPAASCSHETHTGVQHAVSNCLVAACTHTTHAPAAQLGAAQQRSDSTPSMCALVPCLPLPTHAILVLKGVMGSLSGATSAAMRASLIMKLVAHVSSSISSTDAPHSSASCEG